MFDTNSADLELFISRATSSSDRGAASSLQRIDQAVKSIAARFAEVLEDVAEFDQEQQWRQDGATSMTAWLAGRYGLSWGTAREWVRVARALRSLPTISRAFARGDLSWDQVRSLTKFVRPRQMRSGQVELVP